MGRIGIIGGGIAGLCCAWYLRRAGHDVSIIDKGDMQSGCSWGNAGMIVPSHFVPLAAPGMISKGIRWMFNSSSPFYVRLRIDADLFRWGLHFYRSATQRHVIQTAPVLRDFSMLSARGYLQLAKELAIEVHSRGLLMLFRKQETGGEEMETVEMAHRLGMEAKWLTRSEVQALEPNVTTGALGGVYFPGDLHLTPASLMGSLAGTLIHNGVKMLVGRPVVGFRISGGRITAVETAGDLLEFDQVVLTAGAWSQQLGSLLGLKIPVQAGKGYSFMVKQGDEKVSIPTLLLDDRVAVTPMGEEIRFGGTMEIGGLDSSISMKRVKGIVDAIPKYYPHLRVETPSAKEVWHGFRPCSPDGLPFIGRSRKISNLLVATGHGMMGMSLGPGTGRVICDLANEKTPVLDLRAFDPERFS